VEGSAAGEDDVALEDERDVILLPRAAEDAFLPEGEDVGEARAWLQRDQRLPGGAP
jgi:hypothetical protein